ncbi:SGNH/GDSL hydrolase family protein [Flagellimonas pacifica]|uniref:Lysophospholipase L1 n=1 Tax=Flagellimonas pacifica TaxID=1247520 RepID=A0A285MSY4_9FLAO|nr:SGNH/GDSL hydrolase family protein [Allomuricauda parva]SNZ00292.1 Lysophospholipase L1 [Allomuricauda parva]
MKNWFQFLLSIYGHIVLFLLGFLFFSTSYGQEDLPFSKEVKEIQVHADAIWDESEETIVFTGSSSIRLWKDLQDRFPDSQIINTGFGGSQASDLEHHMDELILNYNPKKVFIYEGDNDISVKKRPRVIVDTFNDIIAYLGKKRPDMKIILISAKPSIARWHLKRRYMRLNKRLRKLASNIESVDFADVWTPMLNKRKLKRNLFIEDGLHMNSNGYDLWYGVIKEFMY